MQVVWFKGLHADSGRLPPLKPGLQQDPWGSLIGTVWVSFNSFQEVGVNFYVFFFFFFWLGKNKRNDP